MSIVHRFFWRLFYAYYLNQRGNLAWSLAWPCSADAYRDYAADQSPEETAIGEMSYWSE